MFTVRGLVRVPQPRFKTIGALMPLFFQIRLRARICEPR